MEGDENTEAGREEDTNTAAEDNTDTGGEQTLGRRARRKLERAGTTDASSGETNDQNGDPRLRRPVPRASLSPNFGSIRNEGTATEVNPQQGGLGDSPNDYEPGPQSADSAAAAAIVAGADYAPVRGVHQRLEGEKYNEQMARSAEVRRKATEAGLGGYTRNSIGPQVGPADAVSGLPYDEDAVVPDDYDGDDETEELFFPRALKLNHRGHHHNFPPGVHKIRKSALYMDDPNHHPKEGEERRQILHPYLSGSGVMKKEDFEKKQKERQRKQSGQSDEGDDD